MPWEQAARWLACVALGLPVASAFAALRSFFSDYHHHWPDQAKYFVPTYFIVIWMLAGTYRLLPDRFRAKQRTWAWLAFALAAQTAIALYGGLRPRYATSPFPSGLFVFVADLLAPVVEAAAIGTLVEKAVIAWQERR